MISPAKRQDKLYKVFPMLCMLMALFFLISRDLIRSPVSQGASGLYHYEKNEATSLYLLFAPFPAGFF